MVFNIKKCSDVEALNKKEKEVRKCPEYSIEVDKFLSNLVVEAWTIQDKVLFDPTKSNPSQQVSYVRQMISQSKLNPNEVVDTVIFKRSNIVKNEF